MSTAIPFQDYGISEETGFTSELPESLPDYYRPWQELASNTANLIASQMIREEILKLPLLDTSKLKTSKELHPAQLQLCTITCGYCWERGLVGLPQSLPACVAIPLCDISDKLGLQPGMSYYTLMGNWERIDKTRPPTRDNLKVRYMHPGGQQFVDFMIQNIGLEILFVQAFPAIHSVLEGSKFNDTSRAIEGLTSLTQWVKELDIYSRGFHQIVQPDIYFREIVSFLRGFNETCDLPEGMTYEGVTDRPKRKVINPAASQSVMLQIIDLLLRMEYPLDKQTYFQQQRESWPSNFRSFFLFLQSYPGNVRDMAINGGSEELTKAYDELLAALQHFRSYHVQLFTKFVLIPSKRLREETGVTDPDPFAGMMTTLQEIRNSNADSKIQ